MVSSSRGYKALFRDDPSLSGLSGLERVGHYPLCPRITLKSHVGEQFRNRYHAMSRIEDYVFVALSRRGLVQPAVKCRGREYLRIIYGPEYTAQEHLERLRSKDLGTKRSLALREFAMKYSRPGVTEPSSPIERTAILSRT